MDELSDFTSDVVEFLSTKCTEKQKKIVSNSTLTDPLPPKKNALTETNPKYDAGTQTKMFADEGTFARVDEKQLAQWLRKVYPLVEAEMLSGLTPLSDNFDQWNSSHTDDIDIQTYQKISCSGGQTAMENSQGLATWLSVHTNNAPVLVATTVSPHDDWCEHVNQRIHIFVPKRMQSTSNFVVYTETKTVPIKACLKTLITNPFDKSVFVGSALDGDIYIWHFKQSTGEVVERFNFTTLHGYATAIDWSTENRLLTCHSNGCITQWLVDKQVIKETEYLLQPPLSVSMASNDIFSNEITTIACLNANDFVVGTKDGGVYHCWSSNVGAIRNHLEITALRRHLFMVSSLLKTKTPGFNVIISCDLSGQVFYHDIRNSDDDMSNVIVQIPMPFKNSIACSRDGNFIYCPSVDGSLEIYSLLNGAHSTIKGALRGKGSLIKCSDNGFWIITGLYGEDFQIFYVTS